MTTHENSKDTASIADRTISVNALDLKTAIHNAWVMGMEYAAAALAADGKEGEISEAINERRDHAGDALNSLYKRAAEAELRGLCDRLGLDFQNHINYRYNPDAWYNPFPS
jgi:hypothetical protein